MMQILDSTLRDGAQAEGVSFSVNDRLEIARILDGLGLHYIEAGCANPKEQEFFRQAAALHLKNAKLCAFGATRRKDSRAGGDNNCRALLEAATPVVSLVGKSSALHVHEILQTSQAENLAMIEDSCRFFSQKGREVIFDAEHFLDGWALDPAYAIEALRAAAKGGARTLVLCDTNGGSLPWDVEEITRFVCKEFPDSTIGIHAHDDNGMATASTCAAVRAGARHVQGTFLGFGERVGNANLSAVMPNLQLKLGYNCIPEENLTRLTDCALQIASIANTGLRGNTPFVGARAFAHKGGMHSDGVLKNPASFEHIDPAAVGNRRRLLVSEVAGRAAIYPRIQRLYPEIDIESPVTERVVAALKDLEFGGYSFEGADASFDLLIRRCRETLPSFFELIGYNVLDRLPYENERSATATLKIRVKGNLKIAAAEGEGPVNALDLALREALREFYPVLAQVRLIDYKVRIMESAAGTESQVRVLITSSDHARQWTTVGVSRDIIEASWEALVDSIIYKLLE
ncbi:MAG: citramalate synthase [Oscillospiraceae bacterium]|nr:citramalate synthase [Oscillospiraceae bacterium]